MTRTARVSLIVIVVGSILFCAVPEQSGAQGEPVIVALSAPRLDGSLSIEASLTQRRSIREWTDAPITESQVAQLMWAMQGVTDSQGHRTAPSAGAIYPLEIYGIVRNVMGLAQGVYRYVPGNHTLEQVSGEDRLASVASATGQDWVGDAPFIVVIAGNVRRTAERYGDRAPQFVQIEVGTAAQNLALQAVALGLGGTFVGAFDDADLTTAAGLRMDEIPYSVFPVGIPQ